MTEPLTTPDMDVRDLDGFMLNVERLLASELWALTRDNPLAFRGAVGLWSRAWKQLPPASLPNDEAVIAAFADMPLAKFRKCRDLVMRGFELCADGRYYHRHLAAEVNKIWPSVSKKRRDREADNERLKHWRENKRKERETGNETQHETADETRFNVPKKPVANGVDTDRDTDRDRDITSKKEQDTATEVVARPKGRARRSLPLGFPAKDDLDWAQERWTKAGRDDLCASMTEEIEKFRDHHAGKATASADWPGSWRTWVRNAIKFNQKPNGLSHGNRSKNPSGQLTFIGAGASLIDDLRAEARYAESGDDYPPAFEAGRPLLPS